MSAQETTAAAGTHPGNELEKPMWSVVSFDRCEASGLAYSDAVRTLEKLEQEKIAGLCIVTDEAAARLPHPGR